MLMGEQDVECRRPCAALHGGPPARNSNTFALVSASIGQLALYSQPPPDACDATRRCAARASSWSAYGVRASVNRRTRVTQNVLCSPATGVAAETVGVLFPRQVTRRPDHRIVDGDRCRLRHARRCPSLRRRCAIAGPRVDVAQIVAEALAPVQQLGQQRCATPWVAGRSRWPPRDRSAPTIARLSPPPGPGGRCSARACHTAPRGPPRRWRGSSRTSAAARSRSTRTLPTHGRPATRRRPGTGAVRCRRDMVTAAITGAPAAVASADSVV